MILIDYSIHTIINLKNLLGFFSAYYCPHRNCYNVPLIIIILTSKKCKMLQPSILI